MGFRVFTFKGTAAGHSRNAYTVRAIVVLRVNMASASRNSLYCAGELLERASEGEQKYTVPLTEEQMSLYSDARNVAAPKRKSWRKPLTGRAGRET
jgi:hypothetical protein